MGLGYGASGGPYFKSGVFFSATVRSLVYRVDCSGRDAVRGDGEDGACGGGGGLDEWMNGKRSAELYGTGYSRGKRLGGREKRRRDPSQKRKRRRVRRRVVFCPPRPQADFDGRKRGVCKARDPTARQQHRQQHQAANRIGPAGHVKSGGRALWKREG